MLVPTVHTPASTNTDHRELAAALKLLAGYECLRDAHQAHTMLVRLTESDQPPVSQDARAVLREGTRKDWFGERKPFYQDLVALASRTAGGKKAPARRGMILALLMGTIALSLGVFFFLRQSGADTEQEFVAIAVGIMIIVIAGLFALRR